MASLSPSGVHPFWGVHLGTPRRPCRAPVRKRGLAALGDKHSGICCGSTPVELSGPLWLLRCLSGGAPGNTVLARRSLAGHNGIWDPLTAPAWWLIML